MATSDKMPEDQSAAAKDGAVLRHFLTFRLSRLQAKLNAQAARHLKRHAGISLSEWRAIALIASSERATQAELVKLSGIDKGLLSRVLKGLIESGLVAAQIDDKDHRLHRLSLTKDGSDLHAKTLPRMQERQAHLQSSLSDEERTVLDAAIEKLGVAAEEDLGE